MTSLPAVPTEGVVESYDPSDALGSIRLDSGEVLRFGRSGCSFDPVVGDRVRILAAEIGPLGRPRASRIEALGPRALTRSERIALMRTVLFAPVESYRAWGLACRIAGSRRPEHAAALRAIRDELEASHARSPDSVEEMVEIARWASEVLGPKEGTVQHAIGDADDIMLAVDTAQRGGLVPAAEADRLRERVKQLAG